MTTEQYPTIAFNQTEFTHAAMAGFLRQCENLGRGRQEAYGQMSYGFDVHIMGAVAEAAVARYMDVFWGPGKLRAPDVSQYQVRSSSHRPPFLCLHPEDKDDDRFILVLVRAQTATLLGWAYGKDGKQKDYWGDKWRNGRPAFWVPHTKLRSMEEL